MYWNEVRLQKRMEVSEIFIQFASVCLSGVILLIRNAILVVEMSYSTFPSATLFVLGLILMYFVYRLVYRMIKMFINLAVSMAKTFLLLVCIVFGLCVYLRGWRFVTKDLPYIKSLILSVASDNTTNGTNKSKGIINAVFRLLNIDDSPELKTFSHSILEDLGVNLGNNHIADAFNPYEDLSYEDVHDFVHQKLGSVGDYINEQNINEIGNEFLNLWKLNR